MPAVGEVRSRGATDTHLNSGPEGRAVEESSAPLQKQLFELPQPSLSGHAPTVGGVGTERGKEMAEGLVQWLSDPATLIGLGTVAALAAYYLFTRPKPLKSRIPLERQSVELPVSPPRLGALLRRVLD